MKIYLQEKTLEPSSLGEQEEISIEDEDILSEDESEEGEEGLTLDE